MAALPSRRTSVVLALLLVACNAEEAISPSRAHGAEGDVPRPAVVAAATSVPVITVVPTDSLRIQLNKNLTRARLVSWKTSNATVASVSAQGLVVALTPGTADITASSGSVTPQVTTIVVEPGPAQLVVTPAAVTLATGAKVQLKGVVQSANGVLLTGRTIAYRVVASSIATVSGSGVVTGVAPGQTSVLASSGSLTTPVPVTVFSNVPPPTPTLTSLTISPKTIALATAATAQFSVAALWSDGGTTLPAVTWSATGGTVSANGAYAAPSSAGTYLVIVRQSGGTIADTATITAVAPPPPPPTSRLANECNTVQAAWIFCDDFDQDRLSRYFEVDDAGGSFGRVAATGNEGSYAMRGRFGAGQSSAGSLKLAFGKTPGGYIRPVDAGTTLYREVYWRMFVRNQDGWVGGGGDKLSRATSLVSSGWQQSMIAHVWSDSDNPSRLLIDPASGTDVAGNLVTTTYNDFANLRWLGSASGTTSLFAPPLIGQWHCIEAHVRLNDAGQSNGVFELWVDGASNAVRTGLNWLGAYSTYGINALFLENYWNAGSPATQDRFFDNFIVSTQRIGC